MDNNTGTQDSSLNLISEETEVLLSDDIFENGAELLQNNSFVDFIPTSNTTLLENNEEITYCIMTNANFSNSTPDLNIENNQLLIISDTNEEPTPTSVLKDTMNGIETEKENEEKETDIFELPSSTLLQNNEDITHCTNENVSNSTPDYNQSFISSDTNEEHTPTLSTGSVLKDTTHEMDTVKEKENDFFEFTAKLKKDSEEAYKRRLQAEAEKREKKKQRDREYQRIRYQKLKGTRKKKTQKKENYEKINNSLQQSDSQNHLDLPVTIEVINEEIQDLSYDQSCDSSIKKHNCDKPIIIRNINSNDKTDLLSPKVPHKSDTRLDKLEKIRIKARDRQRKRRSLMTEEQLELKRAKNREYMARKKNEEKENPKEVGEREKRRLAKLNRERVKKCREKKKRERDKIAELEKHSDNLIDDPTSEHSTTPSSEGVKKRTSSSKKKGSSSSKIQPQPSNEKLETQFNLVKRKLKTVSQRCERYKKRFQRLVNSESSPSPSKKIRKLAGGKKLPTPVKRRLKFFETLESGLITKKNELIKRGNQKELSDFNAIICSPKLIKRKVVKQALRFVSYKGYKKAVQNIERKPSARRLSSITIYLVKKFYVQDNVSKMLPGKRDFKSNNKIKKQKRVLMGTYKELLKKFNKEHPTNQIKSVDTFRRLKPFWVVPSKLEQRNTCACLICSNVKLMLHKANILKVTKLKLQELVESSVCKNSSKSCMLNKCQRCDGKLKDNLLVINEDEDVTYFQWVKSNKTISNGKTIKVVIKAKQSCSKKDFSDIFHRKLLEYREHMFKIKHQFSELKALKENLKEKEALVHIDFSENYVCKGHTEPQSMHFGGSKNQISLHTVVIYKTECVKSICTVSTNTDHRAHAIWAHMKPIFNSLTGIETLHLQSDGPSSQYKNRFNLYFITQVKQYLPSLKQLTWNFSISGHGKGASDGVGGTVKRSADIQVKNGKDIFDISTFISEVKEVTKKIEIIEIKSDAIENEKKKLESLTLGPIPSCSKVHQVTWSESNANMIHLRELSCFACKYDSCCDHHGLGKQTHVFRNGKSPKTSKTKHHRNEDKEDDLTTSTSTNPQQDPVFSDPKEDDWLLAKFKGKRNNQYYICVVENVTDDGLHVHCARNVGNMTFKWAEPNDKCIIDYDQIEKKLPSPTFTYKNKRMVSFKFPIDIISGSITVN